MKHGGKRVAGPGRRIGRPPAPKVEGKAKAKRAPAPAPIPAFAVVEGGGEPAEPDWGSLFVDELDLEVARRQWRILIAELRDADKLSTANHHQIKRTVVHQVIWERAARQVAEDGAVLPKKGRRGPKPNLWFGVLKDANAMVSLAEAELTITPRRRNNGGKVQQRKPSTIGGGYLRAVPK